jgi:hypothetical protein
VGCRLCISSIVERTRLSQWTQRHFEVINQLGDRGVFISTMHRGSRRRSCSDKELSLDDVTRELAAPTSRDVGTSLRKRFAVLNNGLLAHAAP